MNKKTLVVIGGSLGSRSINNLIKSELEYIMNGTQTFGNVEQFIIKVKEIKLKSCFYGPILTK